MNVSINIDFVYDGVDSIKAIKEIKSLGYNFIEICFTDKKDLTEIKNVCEQEKVSVLLMLSDLIGLTDAKNKETFIELTKKKVEQAKSLGCKQIIIASGDFMEDISHEEQLKNMEIGIRELLPLFEKEGMTMLIEPINNKVDHPEAGLWSSKEGFDMARRINSPNVKVLFDIYHMQVMEGDVTRTMIDNIDLIAHVHCAGSPGRNEPFGSELDYVSIIKLLQKAGYSGGVGIEYKPLMDTKEGLGIIRKMFDSFMN